MEWMSNRDLILRRRGISKKRIKVRRRVKRRLKINLREWHTKPVNISRN